MTREVEIADHKCGLRQNKKYVLREDTLLFHEEVNAELDEMFKQATVDNNPAGIRWIKLVI